MAEAEAANSGHPTVTLWVTSGALGNLVEESPIWAILWSVFFYCVGQLQQLTLVYRILFCQLIFFK